MNLSDIAVTVETIEPFDDPHEYGLDRLQVQVERRGFDMPSAVFDDLREHRDAGVEEQAGLLDYLRERRSDVEVLNSWTVERVIPALVLAAPPLDGIELEVTCSSTASTKGSIVLKVPGVELGADAKITISRGVTIEAGPGEIRQFGVRVPFIIDRVAVKGNPDRGVWERASVASGEHVPVVELLSRLPETVAEAAIKLDASGDRPGGGATYNDSYTLAKGLSAAITIGWDGDDNTTNSLKFGVERTTEQKIELKARLPGGSFHTGAWLLGPAGVRIDL